MNVPIMSFIYNEELIHAFLPFFFFFFFFFERERGRVVIPAYTEQLQMHSAGIYFVIMIIAFKLMYMLNKQTDR